MDGDVGAGMWTGMWKLVARMGDGTLEVNETWELALAGSNCQ